MRRYMPAWLIVRFASHVGSPLTRQIAAAAENNGIRILRLSGVHVRRHFLRMGASNKHAVAQVVARFLPEFTDLVPPKRKPWQTEHSRYSVLDAAAAFLCAATNAELFNEKSENRFDPV